MRTSPIQTTFSSGEISPLLYGRADYTKFQSGLRTCRGFLPLRQGGFTRAPGTTFLGNTLDNKPARLIQFEFALDDSLLIELTDRKMRIWRYGALVQKDGAAYVLDTPFDQASLDTLKWVQSADVIYMADGRQPIQRLERRALDDWAFSDFLPDDGPFEKLNIDEDVQVQVDRTAEADETVTITANADLFEADDVDRILQIEAFEYPDIGIWTANQPIGTGDQRRFDGNIYEYVDGNARTGLAPPLHTEGTEKIDGTQSYRFVSDGVGIVKITGVTDARTADAVVIKAIPSSITDRTTYRWSFGAWSKKTGYPAALEIYDQRLVAAATQSEPRTIWFSVVGSFDQFRFGAEADDAFAYTISGSTTLNRILWLKTGARGLHVGTLGQQFSLRSADGNSVIGPTTIDLSADAGFGSHDAVPIAPDGRPMLISRDRQRIYEMAYAFESDATRALELTLAAEHLGRGQFEDLTWQSSYDRMAWARRADGTLVAMLHDPAQDVLGFAPYSLADGYVQSLATYPDPSTGLDVVEMVVRRQVNGQTQHFVERQDQNFALADATVVDANHLFCAARFVSNLPDGQAAFDVPHLPGQQVHAWTNQGTLGPVPVVNGRAVFDTPVTHATIGLLDSTHEVETLPIRAASREGDTTGREQRLLPGHGIRVHRTAGGTCEAIQRQVGRGDISEGAREIVPLTVGTNRQTLFSGVTELSVPSSVTKEVSLRIRPTGAAPLSVLTLTFMIEEAGG
ncbi:MAG: hypothetical protein AAFY65_01355 [Pseudomonadota bacterium]